MPTRTAIRVDLAIEIPASREEVFPYLANLENNPHWNWAVTATTPLDGAPRRGSRFIQRRVWPRPGSDKLEIGTYQPPRLLGIRAELEDGEVRYHYQLTALSENQTRVLTTVELEPKIPMRGADLYAARLRVAIFANLESLRSVFAATEMPAVVSGR